MDSETDNLAAQRAWPDERLLRDCRWDAFRASGPGGQKRNKTSSAVRMTHTPSGISAIANESRSQIKNREKALERLRHRMTLMLREPTDLASFKPPRWLANGWVDVSRRGDSYLPVMGLVLDVLAAAEWSVSDAANALGVSTSKVVGFLQRDEKLLAAVNEKRLASGYKALGA